MNNVPPPPGTVADIPHRVAHASDNDVHRCVIIHAAITWFVAYFPGNPDDPADPSDPHAIRVVDRNQVIAYRELSDCDPEWVTRIWRHIARTGPGIFHAPQMTRVWKLAADLAQYLLDSRRTVCSLRRS